MEYTDLILLDIKHIDAAEHKKLTGCENENILDLARYLSEIGKPVWIRHVLVPGRNDSDEYLTRLDEFLKGLQQYKTCRNSTLPHLWRSKMENARHSIFIVCRSSPSKELVVHANELLHTTEYTGYLQ